MIVVIVIIRRIVLRRVIIGIATTTNNNPDKTDYNHSNDKDMGLGFRFNAINNSDDDDANVAAYAGVLGLGSPEKDSRIRRYLRVC